MFKDAAPDFEYDQTRAVGIAGACSTSTNSETTLATFTNTWETNTIGDGRIDAGEDR